MKLLISDKVTYASFVTCTFCVNENASIEESVLITKLQSNDCVYKKGMIYVSLFTILKEKPGKWFLPQPMHWISSQLKPVTLTVLIKMQVPYTALLTLSSVFLIPSQLLLANDSFKVFSLHEFF